MDVYRSTVEYLSALSIFDSWSEMGVILRRAASGRPRDWQLPIIACRSLGISPQKAIPASAALACAQISIILVDDMLDEDPRGEYRHIGHGRAANLAVAFQAVGVEALLESRARTEVRNETCKCLNRMMSTTAFGQQLDIQNPSDETAYWLVVENKSAPFYGCALHLGALFGEAPKDAAKGLEQFGRLYGEMVQIHDDLNDTLAVPASPDWLQRRNPLPILFARSVAHPDRAKFFELCANITTGNALQEAQEILIRCGAVSYCVDQLLRRHQSARGILKEIPLANKAAADSLIEAVIAPVQRLFASLGIATPSLPIFAERANPG